MTGDYCNFAGLEKPHCWASRARLGNDRFFQWQKISYERDKRLRVMETWALQRWGVANYLYFLVIYRVTLLQHIRCHFINKNILFLFLVSLVNRRLVHFLIAPSRDWISRPLITAKTMPTSQEIGGERLQGWVERCLRLSGWMQYRYFWCTAFASATLLGFEVTFRQTLNCWPRAGLNFQK